MAQSRLKDRFEVTESGTQPITTPIESVGLLAIKHKKALLEKITATPVWNDFPREKQTALAQTYLSTRLLPQPIIDQILRELGL